MEMKPVKTIPVPDWMRAAAARKVMGLLNEGAGAPRALFVGGCVRNTLLKKDVDDIDVATVLMPEEVAARLGRGGVKVVPTGVAHGTVTAVIDKKPFEITTLRRDVATDGRRAVVAFTEDWREDARRRDFTMNTLLLDADGHIYDPLGTGLGDLELKRIVFVGNPAERIEEDYLRILRFFRFHAFYGEGEPDMAALAACRAAAGKIENLSRERVTQEFFRILSAPQPAAVLDLMFAQGVLEEFRFEGYNAEVMKFFCDLQESFRLVALPPRLLVLTGFVPDRLKAMEKLILFPKIFLKDIDMICKIMSKEAIDNDKAVRRAVYRCGRTAAAQALLLQCARDTVMNGYVPRALKIIQGWDIPDFPVSGGDLLKAGVKSGPELGRMLQKIEEWWINQDFRPGKSQCLEKAQAISGSRL